MTEVKTLVDELERVKAKGRAILEEHKMGLPAEKLVEVEALKQRGSELTEQIVGIRAVEEKNRDFDKMDGFLNDPRYRVPHGVDNGEDDTTKALHKAGWELKGNLWHAPTSLGTLQPMYPTEVVSGDIPGDLTESEQEFYRITRRALQTDYTKAWMNMLRLTGRMHDFGMAWSMLGDVDRKALSEGTDSAGGFLVPVDAQAEILARLPAKPGVRAAGARVVPTSRDVLQYPMVQPAPATAGGLASGGGSIFSSGYIGTWSSETPAFTDVDPALGSFPVQVHKIRAATKVS